MAKKKIKEYAQFTNVVIVLLLTALSFIIFNALLNPRSEINIFRPDTNEVTGEQQNLDLPPQNVADNQFDQSVLDDGRKTILDSLPYAEDDFYISNLPIEDEESITIIVLTYTNDASPKALQWLRQFEDIDEMEVRFISNPYPDLGR